MFICNKSALSISQYIIDPTKCDSPVDETALFRFRGWPYGDTKIRAEETVWEYYHQKGLPISVVRPVIIYGPRSTTFVIEIAELLKKKYGSYREWT